MLCEVNPKGSLESDWVVYSDSIYLPYEQGTQWWSQEASVSRTEEFPQNAVRHAFATKNAVKGEVAMGVEGGSPMQRKNVKKTLQNLGPWFSRWQVLPWYGQAPCIRIWVAIAAI